VTGEKIGVADVETGGDQPIDIDMRAGPEHDPVGLMRKTFPFDCSAPRIRDGFCPVMRFNTLLDELCCRNFVSSPGMIEKLCQLRIVPGSW